MVQAKAAARRPSLRKRGSRSSLRPRLQRGDGRHLRHSVLADAALISDAPTGDIPAIASPTTIRTAAHALLRVAPARADERWREGLGARRQQSLIVAMVAVSLVLHAALLSFVLLAAKAEAAPPPEETPIEVIEEAPPEAPKPAPPPVEAAHDAPKPPEPPRPEPQTTEPVVAKPAPAPQPSPAETQRAETQRAELEHQLDELKAEQQALKADEPDLGPLRDSIHAVALPSEGSDGDGELVGYQSLVFSQLAKAKDGARQAAKPATVGVRFTVNDDGGLVEVAVAVSSGVADLDAESLAIVRRAAPFPKPPTGAEHTFSANFAYAGARR